jgi:chromosome condensin MukBEF ATPase and DNA-binding subunit MukB
LSQPFESTRPHDATIERELTESISHIRRELSVLRADLGGFQSDGYEHFKTEVLSKELNRIAHLRQRIPPDDALQNATLKGRYEEVKELMDLKESLEAQIFSHANRLDELDKKLSKLHQSMSRGTAA